jgi:hypothetical protein
MSWLEVPVGIREAVGEVIGSPVVEATTQHGGFSPGSADRVVAADGTRAFVKTAWDRVNAETPGIHRREAEITALLPADAPVGRLLGVVDEGAWVAIVLEDVEGRHPITPWRADELDATLDAYRMLSAAALEDDLASRLGFLADVVGGYASAWVAVGDAAHRGLAPEDERWLDAHIGDLHDLAQAAGPLVAGDALVHFDARADNILIRPDGTAIVVDWPWALRGAPWFDPLLLMLNVRLLDPGHDVDAVIARHPAFAGMPGEGASAVLAGLAGMFLERSLQPPVPGIPTLRGFQRAQGVACLDWLRVRLEG